MAPGWVPPASSQEAGRQHSLGLAIASLPALGQLALGPSTHRPLLCPRLPPAVPHPRRRQCQPAPPHSMVLPTLHLCPGCEGEHSPLPIPYLPTSLPNGQTRASQTQAPGPITDSSLGPWRHSMLCHLLALCPRPVFRASLNPSFPDHKLGTQ